MTVYVLFSCVEGRRYLGTFASPEGARAFAEHASGYPIDWLTTSGGQTYGTLPGMFNPAFMCVAQLVSP